MKRTFVLLITTLVTTQFTFAHADNVPVKNKIPELPSTFPPETGRFSEEPTHKPELLLHAQLKTRPNIVLASEITGRIKKLMLRDGQHFKAGQLLAHFSCPKEQSQLTEMRSLLKKQQHANQQLTAMYSVNELEISLTAMETAEAEAKLHVAKALLDRCAVYAPFTGKVVKRIATSSQNVRIGDPLLEIADEDNQEIELQVPVSELQQLKLGKYYQINLDDSHKTYKIKLTGLGGRINPDNQTLRIYGRIDNTSAALPNNDSVVALISATH
jgi:membrane fusion protein, multidrug efflux system